MGFHTLWIGAFGNLDAEELREVLLEGLQT